MGSLCGGWDRDAHPSPVPDLLWQPTTDFGNALRLYAMFGSHIRYCHAFKKWFIWDGYRWRDDTTGEIRRLVKRMIAEFLRQAVIAGKKSLIKFAYASQDQRDLVRIEASARDYLYIEPNKFDAHPFLLTAQNGTLDLRTGVIRPHSPDDYITKLIHVNYNPRAQCPRFRKFLAEILPSPSLRAWLRRVIGYALTGDTSARAVFVLFGRGNNGKTTLLVVIGKLLREYSVVINPDTLMNTSTRAIMLKRS
jgi:putative DNA primase/helicase